MAIVDGTSGNDTLNGTAGDDLISGFDGTDWLYGRNGNDYLDPGNNSDYDWIDAGTGTDTIDFSAVTASVAFYNIAHDGLNAGITATINGTANSGSIDKGLNGTTTLVNIARALDAGGLRLLGTGFDDVFNVTPGDTGNIQLRGLGGNDIFNIGAGSGIVILEYRNAPVGVNVNLATGLVSNDGYGGSDTITGPGKVTHLRGSNLNDILRGSSQNQEIDGFDGNDQIFGGAGTDKIYGGNGNDYLNPGNNSDYDQILAGTGDDIIDFSDVTGSRSFYNIIQTDLNAGITATINGTANSGTIDKGLNGTTTLVEVARALNAGGIRISGTDFEDVFNVTPGNDGRIIVRNSGGNDSIVIGTGANEVILEFRDGSMGADVDLSTGLVGNDGYGDSDTITGPGKVTWLRASFLDDTITGSANDERFALYSGTDTLDAGGGFDTLDYFFLPDAVAALNVDLGAQTATGTYDGAAFLHTISGIERVLGSEFNDDVLRGANARKDVLEGMGGDDILIGRGGGDTLKGGAGADTLKGGSGRDKMVGGAGRDAMAGGAGNDRLTGGAGNDRLDGGAGNDKMTGGGGRDRFIFSAGTDVISDFDAVSNREKIDLSGVGAITGFNKLKNRYLNDDANGNAVIDDGSGNSLTLTGVGMADLDKGDFIF